MIALHPGHRPPSPHHDGATERPLTIAFVGRPNVGKSTFVSRASGRYVEAVNAPGTTVAAERVPLAVGGRRLELVDLPGTRSLVDTPAGGEPFWTQLLATRPDAIVLVADAGDLVRHLPLALACRDLGLPLVVAANLADEADEAGIETDLAALSQLLLAPAHRTVGRTGAGVPGVLDDAARFGTRRRAVRDGDDVPRATVPASPYPPSVEARLASIAGDLALAHSLGAASIDAAGLEPFLADRTVSPRGAASIRAADELEPERWRVAEAWVERIERRRAIRPPRREALTRLATAPWPGLPLFLGVAVASFAAMVFVGGWLSALLGEVWAATVSPVLTAVFTSLVPLPALASALLWALDGGLLAMVSVGIPYVLVFYVVLAILEDSGYLTSAAVLLDRVFNVLGLPGRAAIPLLSAAGCNVPAIYGTRVLPTRRERLLGGFLVTLTPCSARSAVVIAALAPVAGIGAAFAAFGVVLAVTVGAGLAANAVIPGRQPALVLELAPLRMPVPANVARKAWRRFRSFVIVATPIMVVGSFVVGLVYESGLWAGLAAFIEPATMGLLGLPAIAGVAIAFAFLRKELALQLLVALAIVQYGASAAAPGAFLSPAQLFVFAVVTCVSIPCAATLAALAGEFGRRAAITMSAATLGLAVGAGALLARVLSIA
ncbi:MAG TPA: ferrous iron transporter B [Candidatus Limnocylindrales bacterium]|nr:ferrous iron transporter B [Candidatus Limnocylindrales bacterium]